MGSKRDIGVEDRVKILEQAVMNLGDALKKGNGRSEADLEDIVRELKALKLFLARAMPEFKRQFPEIQRKVK